MASWADSAESSDLLFVASEGRESGIGRTLVAKKFGFSQFPVWKPADKR